MCVCVYIYIYIYTHTHTYTRAHTHMHTHTHTHKVNMPAHQIFYVLCSLRLTTAHIHVRDLAADLREFVSGLPRLRIDDKGGTCMHKSAYMQD